MKLDISETTLECCRMRFSFCTEKGLGQVNSEKQGEDSEEQFCTFAEALTPKSEELVEPSFGKFGCLLATTASHGLNSHRPLRVLYLVIVLPRTPHHHRNPKAASVCVATFPQHTNPESPQSATGILHRHRTVPPVGIRSRCSPASIDESCAAYSLVATVLSCDDQWHCAEVAPSA